MFHQTGCNDPCNDYSCYGALEIVGAITILKVR